MSDDMPTRSELAGQVAVERVPGLQGLDQAAVDDEVSAGDVRGTVASQEERQVSYFAGTGEAARDHLAGGLAGHLLRRGAACRAHSLATPPGPSHKSVATGPGLTVLTRMPRGPTSLDRALQKLARPALATP